MKKLIAALLLFAPLAYADDTTTRKPFPDDYTPTTCPTVSCQSYEESQIASAAASFYAFTIDQKWLQANLPKLKAELEKKCDKLTTCFATGSNTKMFCLDLLAPEFRSVCGTMYPRDASASENENCLETVEVYVLGLDQRMQPRYLATRECAMQHPDTRTNKTLDVWMRPSEISPATAVTDITIYANDHDTHIPILGSLAIEGQHLYAPSNPTGALATGYHFKWPLKYAHVKNAEGRDETVGPLVTVNADGYPPVSFRIKVDAPQVSVSVEPALASLRPGRKATVTVHAVDAKGDPVDGRVMIGTKQVGTTNTPFKLTPKKGVQMWVAGLSNEASDVVVK